MVKKKSPKPETELLEPTEHARVFFEEFVRLQARERFEEIKRGEAAETIIEANYKSRADEVDEEYQIECDGPSKTVKFYGYTNGNAYSDNNFREYFMGSPTGAEKQAFMTAAKNKAIARAKAAADPRKFRCKGSCSNGDCGDYPSLKILDPPVIDRADNWPSVSAIFPMYFLYMSVKAHVKVKVQCPCMT